MLQGCWDIHNHILPGLDDGASNIEDTFSMVEQEYQEGIRNIIFTPHYRKGMFEVRKAEREQIFLETAYELLMRFPDMKFYLGCEYYVHSRDNCQEVLPHHVAGTKSVLIEFSPRQSYSKIADTVRTLTSQGTEPILAHVERYHCIFEAPETIEDLREKGARIQINADSLMGENGFKTGRFCKQILKKDWVDFIASDAHDARKRIQALGDSIRYVRKTYGEEVAKRIFVENPKQIFCR